MIIPRDACVEFGTFLHIENEMDKCLGGAGCGHSIAARSIPSIPISGSTCQVNSINLAH